MDFVKSLAMVRTDQDLVDLKFIHKNWVLDHFSKAGEKWYVEQDQIGNVAIVEDFGSGTCRVVGAVLSNGKELTFENGNPAFLAMVLRYYYEKLIVQKKT